MQSPLIGGEKKDIFSMTLKVRAYSRIANFRACLTCSGAKHFFYLKNPFVLATLTISKVNSAIRIFLGHLLSPQEHFQNANFKGWKNDKKWTKLPQPTLCFFSWQGKPKHLKPCEWLRKLVFERFLSISWHNRLISAFSRQNNSVFNKKYIKNYRPDSEREFLNPMVFSLFFSLPPSKQNLHNQK